MPQSVINEIRRKLPIISRKEPPQNEETPPQAVIHQLRVEDIIPNRSQPRSSFHQNAISRLADSIRRYGILQPLTVRKILIPAQQRGKDASVLYELIAGERRLRAAKLAELATVPCIIINTDDATCAELAIIENLLRENLNMFEQAEAFRRLIDEFSLTQEEVARRVSLSQSAVANKLRILRLSPEEREMILTAGLTERHARALLKIPQESLRRGVLAHVAETKMNVSATEGYIDSILDEISRYHTKIKENAPSPAQQSEGSICESPRFAETFLENPAEIPKIASESATPPANPQKITSEPFQRPKFKGAIKDLQLFYNSIRKAAAILEQTGLYTEMERHEDEGGVTLTIRLRPAQGSAKPI